MREIKREILRVRQRGKKQASVGALRLRLLPYPRTVHDFHYVKSESGESDAHLALAGSRRFRSVRERERRRGAPRSRGRAEPERTRSVAGRRGRLAPDAVRDRKRQLPW